jgi:hypothetical protein
MVVNLLYGAHISLHAQIISFMAHIVASLTPSTLQHRCRTLDMDD